MPLQSYRRERANQRMFTAASSSVEEAVAAAAAAAAAAASVRSHPADIIPLPA